MKRTDFVNVILHALAHIPPLRDFFMVSDDGVFFPLQLAGTEMTDVH